MRIPFVKSRVTGAVVAAGTLALLTAGGLSIAGADRSTSPLLIRGQAVDPESFSLSRLHAPHELKVLDDLRRQRFEACMADKGFTHDPDPGQAGSAYNAAYAMVAIGDDASMKRPPGPQGSIRLVDGSTAPLNTTWTPDTCMYKAYASLGSDPFEREAMRQVVAGLRAKAERATIETSGFKGAFSAWSACVGERADAYALLRAVDPPVFSSRPADNAGRSCVTEGISEAVQRSRGPIDYDAAMERSRLVAAWVDLVDGEIGAARAS